MPFKFDPDGKNLSPSKFYQACLNDCTLDEIFADADRWMFRIGQNMDSIAELQNEENPWALTGTEPEWLLELFKKHKVATC